MLNLKKGLALVLAAATVFTFAPLSSLTANANNVTSDGLTTTTGIDSKPANVTVAADGTKPSSDVFLQEHEGKSSNNTLTQAYRITVQKHENKDGSYYNALKLFADGSTAGNHAGTTQVTTTGGAASTTDALLSFKNTNLDTATYIVAAAPQTSDNTGITSVGGAYIAFEADASNKPSGEDISGTYTVTVEGLGAYDENAAALDKSTFTVTIPKAGEALNIKKTSYIQAEGDDFTVAYTISNRSADSNHLNIVTDNTDVASVPTTGTGFSVKNTVDAETEYENNSTAGAGTIKIHAGEAGVANLTVSDHKSDESVVNSVKLQIKVTPANGKLYVTYETSQGTFTFNDDKAFTQSANNTQIKRYSISEDMGDNGRFEDKATVETNRDGYVVGLTNKKVSDIVKADYSSVNYILPATYDTANGGNSLSWVKKGATLPSAKTLYTNGTKTVQINASSDAGATVSYALVAPAYYYSTGSNGKVTATKDSDATKIDASDANAQYGNKTATENKVIASDNSVVSLKSGSYGAASKVVYTETAAREYGSIDKNGLVTLKDGKNAPTLYVVVTAKGADAVKDVSAKRATSTFLVPISLQNQEPVSLYVSDSKFFAEASVGDTYSAAADIHNTLYLSLTDRKTDTLAHKSNVSDNYITVTSSDPSVVSVNGWTLTAQKEGSATITVKTSSAPEVSGIANVKINVVVNKLKSTNVVTAKGVSVNKENPHAKVEASSNVDGSTVIFDRDSLYTVDSNMPSGYRHIGATDDHYTDVGVSTTGNVTYAKNDGTVYVRAYASGTSEYNPATYVYVPVNYGQKVVTTDLKVDQTPITLDVKETKKITASVASGASITYTSQDPTVATVAADGTVTAVKSGTTYVTVTGVAADGTTAESAVVAVIVKGNATITDDTVKPGKVTSLKVSNKKGAHVSVKWASQGKNINYRVWKKVGNGKWVGKNVAGSKTTLSVKKGAKVQVKVKAYVKDANGKTSWGPKATKAKTFKTDKK